MNSLKNRCIKYSPIIFAIMFAITFGAPLRAQERPRCSVKVTEINYVNASSGKTEQLTVKIVAHTPNRELARYESVLGPNGDIKWKELWKFRRKAEETCEDYLEAHERQTGQISAESLTAKSPEAKPAD